jgi:hypothetical protein
MGAYSSWNSFALTHHYLMYWCCKRLMIPWRTSKYIILGDDVLIGDHKLAKLYKDVMTSLGVEISELKTHQSGKLYEFAKRLIFKGTEITPFPISALSETANKSYLLTNLLSEEKRKGWVWTEGIPSTVSLFYSSVLNYPSRLRKIFEEKSFLCELMMEIMRGKLPANDGLNSIIGRWSLNLPILNPDQGLSILSGTALECFVESNPLDHTQGKPLGQLAQDLVMEITLKCSSEIEATDWIDLPSSIPLLGCYGLIEEQYMEISNQAYLIDTIGKGEWPMHLRTLALPFSDKVFSQRASHTITRVGAVLGQRVLRNLKGLRPSDF